MSQKYPGGFITKSPVAPTAFVAKGIWTLDQAMQLKRQGLWPSFTVPGAPTIGTATATGFSTATVAFTAPANNGGTPITSYTATSSPGGITGTLNQAGSGTITVTGLSASTSYTFTVVATNAVGTGLASAASNSITTTAEPAPTVIGQAYAGGYYAGQIGVSGTATHYLVVGPRSSADVFGKRWKTTNTNTAGTSSVIDGPANSAAMNNADHPAAQFCEALTVGGYTDWYMPARNELEICYFNLKPTTNQNNTSSGINENAVPVRSSNYSGGTPATNPARTSAAQFQASGAEPFEAQYYWSSTQLSSTNVSIQFFSSGSQESYIKNSPYFSVRAVRRVPV